MLVVALGLPLAFEDYLGVYANVYTAYIATKDYLGHETPGSTGTVPSPAPPKPSLQVDASKELGSPKNIENEEDVPLIPTKPLETDPVPNPPSEDLSIEDLPSQDLVAANAFDGVWQVSLVGHRYQGCLKVIGGEFSELLPSETEPDVGSMLFQGRLPPVRFFYSVKTGDGEDRGFIDPEPGRDGATYTGLVESYMTGQKSRSFIMKRLKKGC